MIDGIDPGEVLLREEAGQLVTAQPAGAIGTGRKTDSA